MTRLDETLLHLLSKPSGNPVPLFGARPRVTDLGRQSVRSGTVNMVSQAVALGLQMVSTVVMARLLTPEAYGLVGMVMVVVTFAGLFRDLGLSTATIHRETITAAQVSVMFWLNAGVGALLSLVVAVAAPWVVAFYGKPELLWMTVVLGGTIFLASLGAQHAALLARQMHFKRLAVVRLSGAAATLAISASAALAGWSHWALVAGVVGGSLISTALLWIFSQWRPDWPRRHTGARPMVRYGLNLTGFELVNFFSRNLDNILVGRFWGDAALGLYSRAYQLVLFPIGQIRTPLVAVALPALSRLQQEPVRFCSYYRRLLSILALTGMPISAFVVVAAEPLIHTLLGARWTAIAPWASWLAVASFLQPVAGLFGAVLTAKGLANRHLRCGLVSSFVVALTFVATVPHGIDSLVKAYALSGYVLFLPVFLYASRGTGIVLSDFMAAVWRPAACSILAAAFIFFLRPALPPMPAWLELGSLAAAFAALYGGLLLLVPGGRAMLHGLWNHLHGALAPVKADA